VAAVTIASTARSSTVSVVSISLPILIIVQRTRSTTNFELTSLLTRSLKDQETLGDVVVVVVVLVTLVVVVRQAVVVEMADADAGVVVAAATLIAAPTTPRKVLLLLKVKKINLIMIINQSLTLCLRLRKRWL
jgi:hypothetical protein